jgi:putative FmdB family regulatory protein
VSAGCVAGILTRTLDFWNQLWRSCNLPTYEYSCENCGNRYEKREGFDAPAKQKCPKCGKTANRMIFAPPVVFKGSGFYKTDNRGSSSDSGSGDGATSTASAPVDAGHGHSHGPGGHSHDTPSTPTTTETAAAG